MKIKVKAKIGIYSMFLTTDILECVIKYKYKIKGYMFYKKGKIELFDYYNDPVEKIEKGLKNVEMIKELIKIKIKDQIEKDKDYCKRNNLFKLNKKIKFEFEVKK